MKKETVRKVWARPVKDGVQLMVTLPSDGKFAVGDYVSIRLVE